MRLWSTMSLLTSELEIRATPLKSSTRCTGQPSSDTIAPNLLHDGMNRHVVEQ